MKKIFLSINNADIKKFKNKKRLILQHNYFLKNQIINFDEAHQIFLKKKELKNYLSIIQKNYFIYLDFLSNKLNYLNNTKKSKRFWNILIGPWLIDYLQSMTRKWIEIKKISNKNKIFFNFYFSNKRYIPEDYIDYDEFIRNEKVYTEIYSDILKNYQKKNKEIYKSYFIKNYFHKFSKIENIPSLRKIILNFLSFFKLKKKSNLMIINSYMGHFKEILLYLKTLTFPFFMTNLNDVRNLYYHNSQPHNFLLRKKILNDFKTTNNYELFLKENFKNFFPKSYLENFKKFDLMSKNIHPKKTNFIITAVDHFSYDNLKYWIGNQVLQGSKLFTIQHGANPGYSLFTQNEFNDKVISDINFTWGWNDNFKSTKKSFFSFKKIKNNLKKRKHLLIVIPGNIAVQKNIKSNLNFYDNLNFYNIFIPLIKKIYKKYSKELVVRLPKARQVMTNKFYEHELKKISKNIKIDKNEMFTKSLEESKAIITSWDQTVFLQSLNADIPTFAYWNKQNSIVNYKSLKFFLELEKKSILFNNANELINTLEANYYNIDSWWANQKRHKITKKFVNQYCRDGNIVEHLADICNKNKFKNDAR